MKRIFVIIVLCILSACSTTENNKDYSIPALEYSRKVGGGTAITGQMQEDQIKLQARARINNVNYQDQNHRASMHYIKDGDLAAGTNDFSDLSLANNQQVVSNLAQLPEYEVYRSARDNQVDYSGPLALGDPGVTSSLWRSSQRGNNLFQDDRAFQPYDLITIVITENSEGKKEADTEVKTESSLLYQIEKLLGREDKVKDFIDAPEADTILTLLNSNSTSENKGEGDTSRKGSLKASISAMVVEILPGGILRIEGEKIISVNSEEQVLKISGLARPRDVNSNNEINSAKISQLRVDYYGHGSVGSAQSGGWLSNIVRSIWPF